MPAPKGNQYAKGHGHGRPTLYKKEMCDKVREYVEETDLPFVEEVGIRLGIAETTVYEWRKKHEDFEEAIQKLLQKQKLALKKLGLAKNVSTRMAMFLLSASHGLTEKKKIEQDVDLSAEIKNDLEREREILSECVDDLSGNSDENN
jgi:hypothetical protein